MVRDFKAAMAVLLVGLVLVLFLSPAVPVPALTLRFQQAGHHVLQQLMVVLLLAPVLAEGMTRALGSLPQRSGLFGSGIELIDLTCTRLC